MKQRPLVTGAARVWLPAALTAVLTAVLTGGLVTGGGVARAAANGVTICGNVLGTAVAQPCAVAADASSPPGGHPGRHPAHHPGHHPGRHVAHPTHPAHPGQQANPGRPGASGAAGPLAYPSETFAARPAPGEHGSGLLPHTGAPTGIFGALAAAMLAIGIALTSAGRRRPAIATTALPTPTAQEGGGAATNESVRR